MLLVEQFVAGVQALPVVSQPRYSFFVELGQAAESHEVKARASTLVFNDGGNGNDEECRPQRHALIGNRLIEEEAGDEYEYNQGLRVL